MADDCLREEQGKGNASEQRPRKSKGDRRPRPAMQRDEMVSRKFSKLLRHSAEKEGLKLDAAGYANLADVLKNNGIKPMKVTFEEIRAMVADNDKQRFSMIPVSQSVGDAGTLPSDDAATASTQVTENTSEDPSKWLIRANQGHSIKVAEEELLEPLTMESKDLPTTVVHGTTRKAWPLIVNTGGMKPMSRTHAHFATGLPAEFSQMASDSTSTNTEKLPVISGMRNSSTVLIYIDLPKALAGGLKFWRSANGVVLCAGNDDKIILLEYFKLVEDRSKHDGGILMKDGKLMPKA